MAGIFRAAKQRKLDKVRQLLDNKADVNHRDESNGHTALIVSAMNNYSEICAELLKHGANPNIVNKYGESALWSACIKGNYASVEVLLSEAENLNVHGRSLVKTDITLAKSPDQMSPLYIASQEGHEDIVKLLIEHKPNIDQSDIESNTPLYIAAQFGHCNVVEVLLRNGANTEIKSKTNVSKDTPFTLSCHQNKLDVVKILTQHGADINACDIDGNSGLHVASSQGHLDTVQFLISQNVTILKNKYGKTALDLAKSKGHSHIIDVLEKYENETKEKETEQQFKQCLKDELSEMKMNAKSGDRATYESRIMELEKEVGHDVINGKMERLSLSNRLRAVGGSQSDVTPLTDAVHKASNFYSTEIRKNKTVVLKDFSDKHMLQIAGWLGPQEWQQLGGFLSIPIQEIQRLAHDNNGNTVNAAWKMLVNWRNQYDGDDRCKKDALRNAMKEIKRNDLCIKFL